MRKRYHLPATPYQRLLADTRTSDEVRRRLEAVYATLDPVQLLSDIRQAQARLVEIADQPVSEAPITAGEPTLEQFLASLRTAWEYGEVRPTARRKEQKKRERRRPDPFVAVSAEVHGWSEAEPWRRASSSAIVKRLICMASSRCQGERRRVGGRSAPREGSGVRCRPPFQAHRRSSRHWNSLAARGTRHELSRNPRKCKTPYPLFLGIVSLLRQSDISRQAKGYQIRDLLNLPGLPLFESRARSHAKSLPHGQCPTS